MFIYVMVPPRGRPLAFRKEEDLKEYIDREVDKYKLTVKSESGWSSYDGKPQVGDHNDYRVEDSKGNSYYYVWYITELK